MYSYFRTLTCAVSQHNFIVIDRAFVRCGEYDTRDENDGPHEDIEILLSVPHEEYNDPLKLNDIAMIYLVRHIVFSGKLHVFRHFYAFKLILTLVNLGFSQIAFSLFVCHIKRTFKIAALLHQWHLLRVVISVDNLLLMNTHSQWHSCCTCTLYDHF